MPSGPLCALFRAWTAAKNTAVVAGMPEKAGARLYNSAVLIEGGAVRLYRKTHLFGNERCLLGNRHNPWLIHCDPSA